MNFMSKFFESLGLTASGLESVAMAMSTLVLSFFFFLLAKRIFVSRFEIFAKKTVTFYDDLFLELISRISRFFLFVLALFLVSFYLKLPLLTKTVITKVFIFSLLLQAGFLLNHAVKYLFQQYKTKKMETSPETVTTLSALSLISRLALWVVILLVALDNLGIDVTTLIAGLGISGIAVALAVQNILGDLLASLSIVLDKPFVIGDFIVVGDDKGTIEHIGMKTTRIRSLTGEQLILSNADLLKSRIRNYKRMEKRRAGFSLGVAYQTPIDKLQIIPKMIQTIIEAQKQTVFERAHFKEHGPYSLNFEIVYWMGIPDYTIFMDTQQTINLAIHQKFQDEGIEFAFPTQFLYVEQITPLADG